MWLILESSFIHEKKIYFREKHTNDQHSESYSEDIQEGVLLDASVCAEVEDYGGDKDDCSDPLRSREAHLFV
jgi:hypothetical protein